MGYLDAYPPTGPYLEVKREDLRNHADYLRFAELARKFNKELRILDPAAPKKPLGAITLSPEEARDHATYQAAVQEAKRRKCELWVEPTAEKKDTTA